MPACWCVPGPARQSARKGTAQGVPNRHWGTWPWGDVPKEGSTPASTHHPYLGLLQAVVDKPEVLAEELLADGLPVDADPLAHLDEVRGAEGAEGEAQSSTAPPSSPNPPDPPAHL